MFFHQPQFGKYRQNSDLDQFKNSPHFSEGQFRYPTPTPQLIDGVSTFSIFWDDFFSEKVQTIPTSVIPTIKTDLHALDIKRDVIIWLGHSSYFIQLSGQRILIDPVFSEYASPVSFINKAFNGTNIYTFDDIPEIDFLLISHDHWDHLDYPSITQLKHKIKNVITPLGVGEHFKYWGYSSEKIREADWFTPIRLNDKLTIHVLPARHYSGRLFEKNKTLWAGFSLETPERNVFFSRDSGYGPHFKEIAHKLGPFDFVMLDSGQYDPRWPYIHMTPEEATQAANDLKAKVFIPAHIGKFSIARHSWDDPFIRLTQASYNASFELLTPIIGQPVWLDNQKQIFPKWWESLNLENGS